MSGPRCRIKNLACARAAQDRSRALIREYLSDHPCVDCGETDLRCLDFDHRDQATKVREVSGMRTYSEARIRAEIAKCDVRCANCHRRRTADQLGYAVAGVATPMRRCETPGMVPGVRSAVQSDAADAAGGV